MQLLVHLPFDFCLAPSTYRPRFFDGGARLVSDTITGVTATVHLHFFSFLGEQFWRTRLAPRRAVGTRASGPLARAYAPKLTLTHGLRLWQYRRKLHNPAKTRFDCRPVHWRTDPQGAASGLNFTCIT